MLVGIVGGRSSLAATHASTGVSLDSRLYPRDLERADALEPRPRDSRQRSQVPAPRRRPLAGVRLADGGLEANRSNVAPGNAAGRLPEDRSPSASTEPGRRSSGTAVSPQAVHRARRPLQ